MLFLSESLVISDPVFPDPEVRDLLSVDKKAEQTLNIHLRRATLAKILSLFALGSNYIKYLLFKFLWEMFAKHEL